MTGWILGLPTFLAAAVIVSIAVMLSVLGLVLFHVAVPHRIRRSHNEVAGYTIAVVGVIYAVLLAFIAVAVWEDFGRAEGLVQTEANLVGNLYRDTVGLPEPLATDLRHDLFVYAETVVQDEWPALTEGRVDDEAGWQLLDRFHLALVRLQSPDPAVLVLETEMIRNLNALYDARRGRFHAATHGLPPILWLNLIAGAAVTILFSFMFGVPNFLMHVVMVGMLAASIALVLALIILLDSPFRGQNHISAAPFERLVKTVEDMAYPRGG
ncbi:MAG: DUF4239 domain-containing protein [Acetobacteraceae bacterium]|nr:DUF4239 domain-containing protein [Acetobacteraceae bacterium]